MNCNPAWIVALTVLVIISAFAFAPAPRSLDSTARDKILEMLSHPNAPQWSRPPTGDELEHYAKALTILDRDDLFTDESGARFDVNVSAHDVWTHDVPEVRLFSELKLLLCRSCRATSLYSIANSGSFEPSEEDLDKIATKCDFSEAYTNEYARAFAYPPLAWQNINLALQLACAGIAQDPKMPPAALFYSISMSCEAIEKQIRGVGVSI
jgi:hypothetical protein